MHSARNWLTLITEVVREKVQDGLTGETREMQYTQCKIVGNGSFGVVFQTKLSPSGEDAAIKRVLQDKRFKVSYTNWDRSDVEDADCRPEPRTTDHAHRATSEYRRAQSLLLLKWRTSKPSLWMGSSAYGVADVRLFHRKMKSTSTSFSSSFRRPSIEPRDTSTR